MGSGLFPLVFPGSETRGGIIQAGRQAEKKLEIWRCLTYWKPFRNVFSGSKNVFLDGRSPNFFRLRRFWSQSFKKRSHKKNPNRNFVWNAQKWGFSRAAGKKNWRLLSSISFKRSHRWMDGLISAILYYNTRQVDFIYNLLKTFPNLNKHRLM